MGGKKDNKYYREYYARNRERIRAQKKVNERDYGLKKNYGLTAGQWDKLFESQGMKCAVCMSASPYGRERWHTDHDHVSGRVRGILCGPCNRTLGHAKEDATRLRLLADYVEGNK